MYRVPIRDLHFAARADEQEAVLIKCNGKHISVPRSEYGRKVTQQETEIFQAPSSHYLRPRPAFQSRSKALSDAQKVPQTNNVSQTSPESTAKIDEVEWKSNLDKELRFFDNVTKELKKSMGKPISNPEEKSSSRGRNTDSCRKEEKVLPHIYTLENMSESQETVHDQQKSISERNYPVMVTKAPEPYRSSETLEATSAESLVARKTEEVTEKLFQLKSNVVNLIDQTIFQFESEQELGQDDDNKLIPLHPSGDGSKMDHRIQNMQILQTESFAQNKKDIRLKLYKEIESVINRLKDFELLE